MHFYPLRCVNTSSGCNRGVSGCTIEPFSTPCGARTQTCHSLYEVVLALLFLSLSLLILPFILSTTIYSLPFISLRSLSRSLSLALSLALSHSHSLTLALALSLSFARSLSRSLSCSLTRSRSLLFVLRDETTSLSIIDHVSSPPLPRVSRKKARGTFHFSRLLCDCARGVHTNTRRRVLSHTRTHTETDRESEREREISKHLAAPSFCAAFSNSTLLPLLLTHLLSRYHAPACRACCSSLLLLLLRLLHLPALCHALSGSPLVGVHGDSSSSSNSNNNSRGDNNNNHDNNNNNNSNSSQCPAYSRGRLGLGRLVAAGAAAGSDRGRPRRVLHAELGQARAGGRRA